MDTTAEKSSAEIQREIDADRQRIGERIGAIQERMSPGQLIDEVLAYTKNSGGAEYISNLGQALKANPLPVALMGVSMAWLMATQGSSTGAARSSSSKPDDYPLFPVEGRVRRLGPPENEGSHRYSRFEDGSGRRFKALTDDAGHRAGHFVDEAGKTYRGFSNAAGKQVDQIVDETGAILDAASGWASDTWSLVKDTASQVAGYASDASSSLSERSASAGSNVNEQVGKLNQAILTQFRDQPLVGGALAFALGAAIGATLPHTEKEDEALGEAADAAKDAVSKQASAVVDQGKEIASEVYDKAVSVASDVHDAARDRIGDEVESFKKGVTGN